MALSEPIRQQISGLLARERVVLFMKGSRQMPQCGFSAQVVQVLDELLPDYETVDVLRSPELREGIKEYTRWPTIPQLFIGGEFIGGCDIVREMSASGELQKLLGADTSSVKAPRIEVTPAAVEAFRAALAEAGDDVLRYQINAGFENELFLGPPAPGDVTVESNGLKLALDRASARRADGVCIDFVAGASGGFKIENPNQPARVKELSVTETKSLLDRGELLLFDVRPAAERAIASIPGARALDPAGQQFLMDLDRNAKVAFHCHHGIRSQAFAEQMLSQGFKNVYNVDGGIDAWSLQIEPSVPRY
jgi:monothiol glutaredoxin